MFFCVSRLLLACVGAALIMDWSRPASAQEKPSEETRTGIELVGRVEKEGGSFAWAVYPADTQELVAVKQGRGGFLLEKKPPLATQQDSWGFIPLASGTYLVEVTLDEVTRTLKKVEVEPGKVQKLSVAEDFGLDRIHVGLSEPRLAEGERTGDQSPADRFLGTEPPSLPSFPPGTVFSSYFYTLGDIIIFSYFDDTQVEILDSDGRSIEQVCLQRSQHHVLKGDKGVFQVQGNKPFTLLIGDPITQDIVGYFALDAFGKPVGQEFYTYQPRDILKPERGITVPHGEALKVFSYHDSTRVGVFDTKTGEVLALKELQRGEILHLPVSQRFIHVRASAPVSVLSYTDQGFAVPSENGTFVGRSYFTFVGAISEGSNNLNLFALKTSTHVTVTDMLSGELIWKGEVKANTFKSLTLVNRHVRIEAVDNIAVWVSDLLYPPYSYAQLSSAVESSGGGIGKEHFLIANGDTIVLGFEDAEIVLRNLATGEEVYSGSLTAGSSVSVRAIQDQNGKPAPVHITSTGKVTALISNVGEHGAEFVPLDFYGTSLSVKISQPAPDRPLQGMNDIVAKVATSPLYPVTSVAFYLDGEHVGTVHEAPFHLQVDAGFEPQAHEIRVVAHNSAGLEATDQLETAASRGPGHLRVVAADPVPGVTAPSHFELILDASGSMIYRHQKINGRLKMDVAKEVMAQLIHGLPDEAEVALRVYGHRIREGRKGDCQDSELVVPFGKIDKSQLIQHIRKIRALGTTPLAHSLWQAGLDVVDIPGQKRLILVTDGKEECGGKPQEIASQLVRMGIDVRVDVVGFALAEEATKQDMQRIAEITGGGYFDAQDAEGLLQGIQHALAASYDVLDAQGKIVSSGRVGKAAVRVPEGIYSIVVHAGDEPITTANVRVVYNQFTQVELQTQGQEVRAKTQVLASLPQEEVVKKEEDTEQLASVEPVEISTPTLKLVEPEVVADPRIQNAQELLSQVGFHPGPSDGIWGSKTERAVERFQNWYMQQKQPSGVLDEATYKALQDAAAKSVRFRAEPQVQLGMYRAVTRTPVLSQPRAGAEIVGRLRPGTRVRVVGIAGEYLKVRSRKGRPPGYVLRKDVTRVRRE